MTEDLNEIRLNYPPTHSHDDILRILSVYKAKYPDVYQRWEEAEGHPERYLDDGLRDISDHGIKFLKENLSYSSNMALSSAWGSMRKEVTSSAQKKVKRG